MRLPLGPLVFIAFALLTGTNAASLRSTLSAHPSLTILTSLLHQVDLLEDFNEIQNITLIAPTDEAYRALARWGFNVSEVPRPVAQALLKYHVLQGVHTKISIAETSGPLVVHSLLKPPILTNVTSGAAVKLSLGDDAIITESGLQVIGGVVESDVPFDHGVIHTLNASMVLPHNISTTAELSGLTEFLGLVEAAGELAVVEALKDCTIFIPHSATLKKLGPLLKLLTPAQLAKIVRHHVIPGGVLYRDIMTTGSKTYPTLQDDSLIIERGQNGRVLVNGTPIVRQDLIIYGGVAHVIDDLLIPDIELEKSPDLFVQDL